MGTPMGKNRARLERPPPRNYPGFAVLLSGTPDMAVQLLGKRGTRLASVGGEFNLEVGLAIETAREPRPLFA